MASSSDTQRVRSWLPGLVGMLGMSAAAAGTELVADLELAIKPTLTGTLQPGAASVLQLTVTNHGPDGAGFLDDRSPPVVYSSLLPERVDGGLDIYFFPPEATDDCLLIPVVLDPRPPSTQVYWAYAFYYPPIAANESVTCSLRYQLDPIVANQQVPVSWQTRSFAETDPNPANDAVDLVFNVGSVIPQQPATPVPGLNIVGIGLLMLGVLGFGLAAGGGRRQ